MIKTEDQKIEGDSNNITEIFIESCSIIPNFGGSNTNSKMTIDCFLDNQLIKLKELSKQSRLVGFRLYPATYSHKIIELVHELKKYSSTHCLTPFVIIAKEELLLNPVWYIDNMPRCNVFLCHGRDISELDFISSVVIQENYMCYSFFLPKGVMKIGIAHGVDVDVNVSLYEFGGAYEFDALLIGSQRQSEFEINKFSNKYTKELMKHSSDTIKLVPFGIPKLDRFINMAASRPKDIIYHISHLSVEEDWVLPSIENTIGHILDTFPNHRLVFRPYPDDIHHPILQKVARAFSCNKRFRYSTAPDYVDDYINAAVMITHYEYREHIFMASGGVNIIYSPFPRVKNPILDGGSKMRTIFASTYNELSLGIDKALKISSNMTYNKRILFAESHGYYNVGRSISNLAEMLLDDSFKFIDSYPLKNCNLISPKMLLRYFSLNNEIPFHKFMLLLINDDNEEHRYLIFLAEACRRAPDFANEYWQLGLSAVHIFLSKVNGSSHCKQLSYMLDMWWKNSGAEFFNKHITLFLEKGGDISDSAEQVLSLMTNRMKCFNPFPCNYVIENIDNGRLVKGGGVCLFGSGDVSRKFIDWNIKKKNKFIIEYVFDSSPERIGQYFAHHTIMSPNDFNLNGNVENIIICSYYSMLDIYVFLRKNCNFQGNIYIWHNNYLGVY